VVKEKEVKEAKEEAKAAKEAVEDLGMMRAHQSLSYVSIPPSRVLRRLVS